MWSDGRKGLLLLLPHRRELSDDEMEELLLRLPAKQILQCKLLSKPYYDLIKSPRFINKHYHYHSNITGNNVIDVVPPYSGKDSINGIAYLPPSTQSNHLYVPLLPNFNQGFSVLSGSCNGLLCAKFTNIEVIPRTTKYDEAKRITTERFVLWNPATRDHMIVSPPGLGYRYDDTGHMIFSPPDATGLGYDPKTDNYKFVKIHSGHLYTNASAEFWSMKSNCWRKVLIREPVFFGSQKQTNFASGTSVAGSLYWLASRKKNCGFSSVLVFDMVNNVFRKQIDLPDDVPYGGYYNAKFVCEFMGSLAFVNRRPSGVYDYEFDVWVLTTDDKDHSWTKQFSCGPFPDHIVPGGRISVKGKFLFRDKSRTKEEEYFWYDPCNKKIKEVQIYTAGFSTLWSFSESLVPVNQR